MAITIGSLFSGIGGLELGLERGIPDSRTVWQVEIDSFARRVLERQWPHARRHDDIRTAGDHNLEPVDVICGGFPCQDISVAGRGAGLDGARSGLFFEYVRIVRVLRPRVIVMENVTALLARGLGRILGELAAIGYDAEWDCIPASSIGAPHQRDRIFIIAYANGDRLRRQQGRGQRAGRRAGEGESRDDGAARAPPDTVSEGLERASSCKPRRGRSEPSNGCWAGWSAPSAIRRVDDGLSAGVDRPRPRRRPANDKHRLKALGNAVVPAVAEVIGRRVARVLGVA